MEVYAMQASSNNGIKVSKGKSRTDIEDGSKYLAGTILEDYKKYANKAEEIRQERCPGDPPDVIPGTAKTDENFHPVEVWDEVPSVHDDYFDRREKRFSGEWNDQDLFLKLYYGEFDQTRFSQREAESILARGFAFVFGKNRAIVAYEMENLPFDTEYKSDPWHRESVLEYVNGVQHVYCEGIDLATKCDVAQQLLLYQSATVAQLSEHLEFSKRQISNVLNVMEVEGSVERDRGRKASDPDVWIDNGITNDYLDKILKAKQRLEE